jgi:intracellular sulfur oxidation DsrE/DsrF family protein
MEKERKGIVAFSEEDFKGLREAKVIWDITIGDERLFKDRLKLIQETADSLRKKGIIPKFIISIHGPATKFVTKSFAGTVFEKEKIEGLPSIHKTLQRLAKKGIRIQQCGVTLKRGNIAHKDVLPFIAVEENVWVNMSALLNKGYACMPIHYAEPLNVRQRCKAGG